MPDPDDASKDAAGENRRLQRWAPWPVTLGQVRGWLTPWTVLQRWGQAWRQETLPPALQRRLEWAAEGKARN